MSSPGVTTGLDPVEPGLVQVHRWRPDPDDFAPGGCRLRARGGRAQAGAGRTQARRIIMRAGVSDHELLGTVIHDQPITYGKHCL